MLIEACAGLLDADEPEVCARKEAIEETGYEVGEVEKVFELYMSPGGVTELIHFYMAEYSDAQRDNAGGGIDDEDIDVLEIPFRQALEMVASGEIRDGKTVILLQQLQLRGVMN
jgi:GDP-mannose pyrophosphatase NudK